MNFMTLFRDSEGSSFAFNLSIPLPSPTTTTSKPEAASKDIKICSYEGDFAWLLCPRNSIRLKDVKDFLRREMNRKETTKASSPTENEDSFNSDENLENGSPSMSTTVAGDTEKESPDFSEDSPKEILVQYVIYDGEIIYLPHGHEGVPQGTTFDKDHPVIKEHFAKAEKDENS